MRARLAVLFLPLLVLSASVAAAKPPATKAAPVKTLVARTTVIEDAADAPALTFTRAGQGYKDQTGGEWSGKSGKGDELEMDRLANEHATAAIYRLAEPVFGTAAPEVRLTKIDGKPVLLSRKQPLDDGKTLSDEQLRRFGDGFVIDAWLANWEVGSAWHLAADTTGRPVRTGLSGGALFRPKGDPKGAAFTDQVGELQTMRDPLRPGSFAFRHLGDRQIKEQLQRFAAWWPAHRADVEAAIDATSLGAEPAALLKAKLAARAQFLVKQAKK